MSNEITVTTNVLPFAPSKSLIIDWMLKGELWRLGIGEDPNWGQHPIDQIVITATIHELANKIADPLVREQVQTNATKGMENTIRQFGKETMKK